MAAVINVEHLHKRYGDTVAVEDVSFSVEEGEIFGILGPNGAGKSTTVECIDGLRRPDGGRIAVLGLDPQRDQNELHQRIGVQLQESELPEKLRVAEALDLYSSFYRRPADWRHLAEVLGLADKLSTPYKKLSGGQKQRLSIALALIGNPTIAVLDELTTGLDPAARRDTWALIEDIRHQGVTILLVTHFMEEAERLCDRVAVISAGHVIAIDTPDGLATTTSNEQSIRFRPSQPVDDSLLAALPEVTAVRHHGDQVVITGTGNVLAAVVAALASRQVIAEQLRVDQANLEDAFVALTGQSADPHGRSSRRA
jgi:ABC-2 type transport system ATP-binding protein